MLENKYIGNSGQREYPLRSTVYERLPYKKPSEPETPDEPLELNLKFKDWTITYDEQYELPMVLPVMLDWFWANIEKGYLLWAPGDHKWCQWEVAPSQNGWIGSVCSGGGQFYPGGPVDRDGGGQAMHMDMDWFPFTTCMDHAYVEKSEVPVPGTNEMASFVCIMQYKAISTGTHWRSTMLVESKYLEALSALMNGGNKESEGAPLGGHIWYEISRFSEFLPTLYDLWKDVPSTEVNVPNDLRVIKCDDGTWKYKNPYRPEHNDNC